MEWTLDVTRLRVRKDTLTFWEKRPLSYVFDKYGDVLEVGMNGDHVKLYEVRVIKRNPWSLIVRRGSLQDIKDILSSKKQVGCGQGSDWGVFSRSQGTRPMVNSLVY